ncbi:metallophosphoesterase family protein [Cognatishimia sp. SS12]|uniref:metallophosphoesterase family protein n=1 Tax=Cognatishimia sp. SS12 TaxID=2979465 RepID=UPI00232D3A14|nr:metallophosphoesterase family protein [Cognatishimia sp. SS12]MDC0737048.1 metallophosphoesterase family protein [Cognatishimia sp. SS12]
MKTVDLGVLDGPLLLFGGPYSNLQATKALLSVAQERGIAPTQMICTGDLVAYCADGAATVALLRDHGCAILAGNCEKQLAAGALDCGCGFDSGTTCDLLSAGWYAHANDTIDAGQRDWMADLPDLITFSHAGRRYAVVHGGATDISRFVWPTSPDAVFAEEFAAITQHVGAVDAVIAGHSGLAFERVSSKGLWLNAGAIGMPANNGDTATRYMLLQGGQVEICALKYDYDAAARAMEAAGLRQGYHSALRTGYWPSEEVLPLDLRRAG